MNRTVHAICFKANLRAILIIAAGLLGTAASAQSQQAIDPFESINRQVYAFNDVTDRFLLRPAAVSYQRIFPRFIRSGIGNFFDNARYPLVFINQFLQGKVATGFQDTARFLVNSSIGIAGFLDVATELGLAKNAEDFGQTLGVWGVGTGPYVVVPFWGPATFRDGLGDIADFYAELPTYIDHVPTRNTITAVSFVVRRQRLLAAERILSGDKYLFIRDAYLQQRQFLVTDGEDLSDPFLDDL
ncbi:MAG: VacJ family lipoprotein [Proteobacteria bacterium]|nr:VacJ family lipoprotein [Pseudomonadota bacterium]